MATRDYVKRGKKPRKPAPRRTASAKQSTISTLKWHFLSAFIVMGFVFFLLHLSSQPAHNSVPVPPLELQATSKTEEIRQEIKPKEDLLPAKLPQKWTYMETLKNKEVEVDINEQQLSTRPYLLQCGAYKNANSAEARKANIAFQGLESQVKVTEEGENTWFRVVLGPYDLKRKAESDRNLLRRAGIEPCGIWFWGD